jgi:hypothetical protein
LVDCACSVGEMALSVKEKTVGISRIWAGTCRNFELVMVWVSAWFVVFWIVIAPLVFLFQSVPAEVFWFLLQIAIGGLGIAAVYDLTLRIRGRAHLITRFLVWLPSVGRSRALRRIYKACAGHFELLAILFSPLLLAIAKCFTSLAKLIGVVLALAIAALLVYWLFGAVAALPVSVAVIIGAIIIAGAVSGK